MTTNDQIISLKTAKTQNSQTVYWQAVCASGKRTNIFQHDLPHRDILRLFEQAGYGEFMKQMEMGEIQRWRTHPIEIVLEPDGKWFKVSFVSPRNPEARPDLNFLPDPAYYKKEAAYWAKGLLSMRNVVILDTETTGLESDDEIISISILDTTGGILLDRMIVPLRPDHVAASETIHGMSYDSVGKCYKYMGEWYPAASFEAVYSELRNILAGMVWCIYNADFDVRMLEVTCAQHNLPPIFPAATICAMEMYAAFAGRWNEKYERFDTVTLSEATAEMGIPHDHAHSSYGDTAATLALINMMAVWKAEPF